MQGVYDLAVHIDDRGALYEILRCDSPHFLEQGETWGQVYIVENPQAGTVRAFHRHQEMVDWYSIIRGSAKFVLFHRDDILGLGGHNYVYRNTNMLNDLRAPSLAGNYHTKTVVLTARKPQVLVCPRTVWHGWMSLEPNTMLLTVTNVPYNREQPDEERLPWDFLGEKLWGVQFR